jgi:hypothetical protein
MTAATIGIGVVAGYFTLPIVCKILPASWVKEIQTPTGAGKARGLINVAIGILVMSMIRNKRAKEIGIVIAGMGVYDLIALNIPALGLPALQGSNAALDKAIPSVHGSYTAGRMYGALGPSVVGAGYTRNALGPSVAGAAPSFGPSSYGQSSYGMGGSYESPAARAFGNDLDLDSI